MKFIIDEAASVRVAIREKHLPVVPLIILKKAFVDAAIGPAHHAVPFTLACLEAALILSLFDFARVGVMTSRQAVVVL